MCTEFVKKGGGDIIQGRILIKKIRYAVIDAIFDTGKLNG